MPYIHIQFLIYVKPGVQPQAFTEHFQPRHEGPDSQQTISLTKKIALILYEQTLYTTLLYTPGRKYELITKF